MSIISSLPLVSISFPLSSSSSSSSSNMASKRSSITFFLLVSFLTFCACSEHLLSCLSSGGVKNFTSYNNSSYVHLLDHSIQNLRYAKLSVPKPFAVILPENTQQVATAIRCSTEGFWEIRLRSGGHSYEGLSSVADAPFVIIDLMNLNRVSVDLDSEMAWVQGGATLGEIYHAIGTSSNGYAFAAGLGPTVGSGGHISGGGYGSLVRKYGLAVDNVVDALLIDAQGRVLDREAMGEEIFWAIRGGGGGNWGVVVSWKIRLLDVPDTVAALHFTRTGTPTEATKLWSKWQLVAPELEDDFFLMVSISVEGKSGRIAMNFIGLYLGPKPSALDSIYRAFPELGVIEDECKDMRWIESTVYLWIKKEVRTIDDLNNRSTYTKTFSKSKADYIKDPIPLDGIQGLFEMMAKQPKASIRLDPYGGMMNKITSDATPFPHREGVLYSIEYFVDWNEEEEDDDDEYMDWVRMVYEYMEPFACKSPRAVYVNNVDLDLGVMDWKDPKVCGVGAVEVARAWGEKYFMGNYDRLVRVKTLIDPSNVFRHSQSIPPLVREICE